MTSPDIARYRMVNQQISATAFKKPAEIVRWLGAVQAQEYALSKWAIGLRLPGSKDDEIEAAFTKGEILRTHLLRPTWHFITPADIRWMMALTAPRVNAINSFYYRQAGLDDKIFNKANDVFVSALNGGKQLTRTVLQSALKQQKIIADGLRLSYIIMQAELEGIICSGARAGRQFTYALLEERVPSFKRLDEEEALGQLTERYFNSRGPATLKDFMVWSGLTSTQVKKEIGLVSSQFEQEQLGEEVFYYSSPVASDKKHFQHALILPPYDEYIMGYKNRDAIFFNHNKKNPLAALMFDNTIIIEGQVAGSWRRTMQKSFIEMEYQLFDPRKKKHEALLKRAAGQFASFMELPVRLKLVINK